MEIQIKNTGIKTTISAKEQIMDYITSYKLTQSAGEIPRLEIDFLPHKILFEGDADVIAVIDGRTYRLIEENTAPSIDETVNSEKCVNDSWR